MILALVQAWTQRQRMNPDGVSYLEVADAYLGGNWRFALNAFWSPLYSWALVLFKLTIGRLVLDEFTLAHLLNLSIFAGAFAAFDRLLARLVRFRRLTVSDPLDSVGPVPAPLLQVVGYTLFLWSSLALVGLGLVTPDLMLCAFVYLACSLLMDLRLDGYSDSRFALLGLVLGFGYLAKAPLFPLSPVFIAAGVWITQPQRRLRGALIATCAFFLIAGPFVAALTIQKGRPTFGDSGRLNYAWYVGGIKSRHWQGGTASEGIPRHATRQLLPNPPIFEFAGPIGATYPVWYDPSYWYEGATPQLSPRRQLAQIATSAKVYYSTFFNPHWGQLLREGPSALIIHPLLLLGLISGLGMAKRPCRDPSRTHVPWILLVPSLTAFGMFSLVHVETRYVAAFAVILFLSLLVAVRTGPPAHFVLPRLVLPIGLLGVLLLAIDLSRECLVPESTPNPGPEFAQGLRRIGIGPGDQIASLEYSNPRLAALAHQADLKIVAELYREDHSGRLFWLADHEVQSRVLHAFGKAGAVAVLSNNSPPRAKGWTPVGGTGYHAYLLRRAAGVCR
jgi:hypothetical protein